MKTGLVLEVAVCSMRSQGSRVGLYPGGSEDRVSWGRQSNLICILIHLTTDLRISRCTRSCWPFFVAFFRSGARPSVQADSPQIRHPSPRLTLSIRLRRVYCGDSHGARFVFRWGFRTGRASRCVRLTFYAAFFHNSFP